MYKCYPYSVGVQISVSTGRYVLYNWQTHRLIDNGDGTIKMQRKADGLYEFLIAAITDFTDTNGSPISTTFQGLQAYLDTRREIVAGEGVAVDGVTVSLTAGGPSTLGGYKVGTGLTVDGSGRLSASASSEITRILSNEAEMLALPIEDLRSYRVIRLDTKRVYYTNAGAATSVLANWFVGPSIEASTLSFKGRTGNVEPEFADYNFELIPLVDKNTSVTHKLIVDDGKLYIENITTAARVRISYASDTDSLIGQVNTLETLVSGPTGLSAKVAVLTDKVNVNTDIISNATTGLSLRVKNLEDAPGNGNDYGSAITVLQQKDVQQDNRFSTIETTLTTKATLGSNGKVLPEQLPTVVAGVTKFNGRSGDVTPEVGDYTYTTDDITPTSTKGYVSNSERSTWNSKETTSGAQTKADAIKSYSDTTFVRKDSLGVANGVPTLNSSSKIPTEFLPPSTGQTARTWSLALTGKAVGVWYKNNSTTNEVVVVVKHKTTSALARYTQLSVRQNSTSQYFHFYSWQSGGNGTSDSVTIIVPPQWEYSLSSNGGTTIDQIDTWYVLS